MRGASTLAKIVYRRTYARVKADGKLENFKETVQRAIRGNLAITDKIWPTEGEMLEQFLLERKAMPAGRGLWFSGTEAHARLGGTALCNCWGVTLDNYRKFVTIQDLLMLGGGVGANVQHRYVSKLPRIQKNVVITHKLTRDADYIVPDSREGWCELLSRVLEAHFVTGKNFTFSTICLRPEGERINGFGGLASGPRPMIAMVDALGSIMRRREGKCPRPIDVGDIICAIAEMVISGNVRRSAIILLGDAHDKLFLQAKRWDLQQLPKYRSNANYSVVASDVEDIHPAFWQSYEIGEAIGIINLEAMQRWGRMGEENPNSAVVVNPCQPDFATVLTPKGIQRFKDIDVGSVIWSGKQWTTITRKLHTGNKEVFVYDTPGGRFIGTNNHKIIQAGISIEVKDAQAIDICPITQSIDIAGNIDPQDIMDGLVLGDGGLHKASNNLRLLYIGVKDQDYFDSEIRQLIGRHRPGIKDTAWEVTTNIQAEELPVTFERVIPQRYMEGAVEKRIGVLRGLFTANGCTTHGRVQYKGSSRVLVERVQELLMSLGIGSSLVINKSATTMHHNGEYTSRESYNLILYRDSAKFMRIIGFIQKYKMENPILTPEKLCGKANKIRSCISLGLQPVWDITVDAPEHTYWTGGLLVSNCGEIPLEDAEPCNLGEIALPRLTDLAEFTTAGVLMHRWGKRVTMEHYHIPEAAKIIAKNRKVGTGITGCLESPLFTPENLDHVYKAIVAAGRVYSQELGINDSLTHCTVKPSGTLSKIMDCLPGIHAGLSQYMIQRVRFAANDALIPLLIKAGHKVEPVLRFDGSKDHDTLVVEFLIKLGDDVPTITGGFSLKQQLDTLLMVQKYWSDNSVSVTVYYQKQDIPFIKEWLTENLKNIKGISFLSYAEHGFVQAPMEAITKEVYEREGRKLKELELDEIEAGSLESIECATGACPVK